MSQLWIALYRSDPRPVQNAADGQSRQTLDPMPLPTVLIYRLFLIFGSKGFIDPFFRHLIMI